MKNAAPRPGHGSRSPDAAQRAALAISAFTRVFDALWRCAAEPGPRLREVSNRGPGSAKQREERCIAPGTSQN
jgi:hypothetical protein